MNAAASVSAGAVEYCQMDIQHRVPYGTKDCTEVALNWREPAEDIELGLGEIHLWRVWLDQEAPQVEECRSWLSGDERGRANRFHFRRDQARYIVGRGWLRMILAHYLDLEPDRVCLNYGKFGKPGLQSPPHSQVRFNLSHSDELATYAFSADKELGVDVERVRVVDDADAIMERFLPSGEVLRWRGLSSAEQPRAFLRSWVRREAVAKLSGCGLAEALSDHHAALNHVRVQEFTPSPGFVGALAW